MDVGIITSKQMTLEEYLEFDANSDGRFEYFDGEVFELSGGSPEHALLSVRIGRLLSNKVKSDDWLIYSSSVKIKVPSMPPYRYADLCVVCGRPEYEQIGSQKLLFNPTLIIEIIPMNMEKYVGYKSIASFNEYLLISQVTRLAILYTKHNEKVWLQSEYEMGESVKLESLDCELSVDEIYRNIF